MNLSFWKIVCNMKYCSVKNLNLKCYSQHFEKSKFQQVGDNLLVSHPPNELVILEDIVQYKI